MGFQYGWFDQFYVDGKWVTLPQTPEAEHALAMVRKTVEIIDYFQPRYYVMENPKALLRKTEAIPYLIHTVWYCHYGEKRAKPTDLWGHFPESLVLSPECHNQRESHPPVDCCCRDHTSAPRGSRTGTQGMNREESAKIPYPLALAFCEAAEHDS